MKKYIIASFVVLAAACGSEDNNHDHDHENNHEHATVEADACEHMADGPAQPVTAAGVGGDAPTISDTHTRFDVTGAADQPVMLRIEVAEASELHFFFDQDVTLSLKTAAGDDVVAEEQIDSVAECADVAEGAAFDLGVGTYDAEITAASDEFSLVMVPGDHEGHEE